MKATKKNKTRFRKNLKQFAKLKANGTLNGSAASIEEKLQTAAGDIGLDYDRELKKVSRENPDESGKENILRGIQSVKSVIESHEDVDKAIKHPELGWISFVWGRKGNKKKGFAGGYGVSHIIAKRDDEAINDPAFKDQKGKDVALRLPIVIAKGELGDLYQNDQKRNINYAGYRVTLSRDWKGKNKKWVLTGFRVSKNRKNPGEIGEVQQFIQSYAPEAYINMRQQAGAGFESQNKQKSNKRENPCGCDSRANPETAPKKVKGTCEVTVQAKTNARKHGIEIRFSDEPNDAIKEQLKENGFLFFTPKGKAPFWSAKISKKTKEAAEAIAGTFDSAVVNLKPKSEKQEAGSKKRKAKSDSKDKSKLFFSIKQLQSKFDDYNARFFDGKLQKLKIEFKKYKNRAGQYHPSKKERIVISTFYKFPKDQQKSILAHEMIHAWQYQTDQKDKNHGVDFVKKMEEINASDYDGLEVHISEIKSDVSSNNLTPKKRIAVLLFTNDGKSPSVASYKPKGFKKDKLVGLLKKFQKTDANIVGWEIILTKSAEMLKLTTKRSYRNIGFAHVSDTLLNEVFDNKIKTIAKSEKQEAKSEKPATQLNYELGAETTVDFKADGSIEKTGDYAIVDVNDLQASHNKDCTPNSKHLISRSQPRDRSSEALCAQPSFIAKNLNPASITQGNLAFVGAPVATDKGQIIQGNGRTIALKIAYDEKPESAKKYRQYLVKNAAHFGLSKSQVDQFKQPVLVRMLPVNDKTAIELGNVVDTSQAKMSKIDQAKAYIRNLSENQLSIIGKLIQNSSGETIGAIIDDVGMDIIGQMKKLDRTGIVEKNALTAEGKDFLRSVLVGLVFDGEAHPNALHHYLKLPHRIKAGLERSFGYIIPLIGSKGDLTDTLARAVEIAAQTHGNEAMDSAADYTGSKDMFEAKNFSNQETALAQFFLDASTQKEIRDAFGYYVELLEGKENLFGKTPPKSKKEAFKIVFIDRARPNPENEAEQIIHQNIVHAQRLQNFGHDNSDDLAKLDYLLGPDGWEWNDDKTQIIRSNDNIKALDKPTARKNPETINEDTSRAVLDDFYRWINNNPLMDYEPGEQTFQNWIPYHYPGYEEQAGAIWATARPALRKNADGVRLNPIKLYPKVHNRRVDLFISDASDLQKKVVQYMVSDKDYATLTEGKSPAKEVRFYNILSNDLGLSEGNISLARAYRQKPFGDFMEKIKSEAKKLFSAYNQHPASGNQHPASRTNPAADMIYLGISDRLQLDQGAGQTVTLQGPQAMLTNKAMNKLFITPLSALKGFDGNVNDQSADQAFAMWNSYAADGKNYSLDWPDGESSQPVGTADEIIYISDKIIQKDDKKGKKHTYRHKFDTGERPTFKRGNMLIINNLKINQRGILN